MISGKKIVVTGGAGFIGSNLTHELAKEKHNNKVMVIDDLSMWKQEISTFFSLFLLILAVIFPIFV